MPTRAEYLKNRDYYIKYSTTWQEKHPEKRVQYHLNQKLECLPITGKMALLCVAGMVAKLPTPTCSLWTILTMMALRIVDGEAEKLVTEWRNKRAYRLAIKHSAITINGKKRLQSDALIIVANKFPPK